MNHSIIFLVAIFATTNAFALGDAPPPSKKQMGEIQQSVLLVKESLQKIETDLLYEDGKKAHATALAEITKLEALANQAAKETITSYEIWTDYSYEPSALSDVKWSAQQKCYKAGNNTCIILETKKIEEANVFKKYKAKWRVFVSGTKNW